MRTRVLLCTAILLAAGLAAAQQHHAPRHAKLSSDAASGDFKNRVHQYLDQRKAQAGTLPGPTKSGAKLTNRQQQIGEQAQANRKEAKQGDIFTPDVAIYFRKQIASALTGRRGARILTSLRRAEPMKNVTLAVNQPYPEALPFQSMPPSLLLKLPKLPKEVEYRIVGNDLILRDTEANLVIDILPDALPKA